MNVLIACEESQEVCKAFREKGHDAFSCDVKNHQAGTLNGTFWVTLWKPLRAAQS